MLDWLASPVTQRVLLVSILANVSCALVGCFLVLRRMSLMGDALSHAVLPGLVLAFLWTGSMGIVPLFVGAIVAGLATTYLTQSLQQFGRVPADASLGVVFTSLFAFGVILLKRFASDVHFDIACVYEGSLGNVATDTREIAGYLIPRTAISLLPVLVISAAVVVLLWKEFKLTAFDPGLATTMGYSAGGMHYLLMSLVALVAVASFEAVGSILVVAMLIVPPATAQLLVSKLWQMIAAACAIAVLVAIAGYGAAHYWDVSPAGMMAVVAGLFFTLAVLFSPQQGVVASLWRNAKLAERILEEDLLAMIYRVEEQGSTKPLDISTALQALEGRIAARWALWRLRKRGQVTAQNQELHLSPAGRERARLLVRSHRLWEAFLHEHLGLPKDHLHEPAHRVEHYVSPKLREQLEAVVQDAAQDPHGRKIPDS